MTEPQRGSLHHVELWVPDLGRAVREWGWLLGRLGYEPFQDHYATYLSNTDGFEAELIAAGF
jgi:hypothetical protein